MRLKAHHYVVCSALTLAAGCSSDPTPAVGTAGAGGSAGNTTAGNANGGGTAGKSAGGASAGASAAGASSVAGAVGTSGSPGTTAGSGGGGAGGMAETAGTAGTGGVAVVVPVCGNGMKEDGEACDDGGKAPNDGCSATCTIDAGYTCPTQGVACTPICGDGTMIAPEKCDDKNTAAGDGCSATCTLEKGWECNTVGQACTTICGDGTLAGDELCDDGGKLPNDGCSATCTPETGYVCDLPGVPCRKKPDCTTGACTSTCGDGLVIGEACDDGNVIAGDGCSATCTVEATYTCATVAAALPAQLAIPVTYRDFVSVAMGGSTKFPDQQAFAGQGITPGMLAPALDVAGLPVYTGVCEKGGPNEANAQKCPYGAQSTSKANFDMWYRNTDTVNLAFPGVVKLDRVGQTDAYVFNGGSTFTPLTGKGWDKQGKEGLVNGKNFGFTTELRYFFAYQGDEVLEFSGDDDVWVFINGKLAVAADGYRMSRLVIEIARSYPFLNRRTAR